MVAKSLKNTIENQDIDLLIELICTYKPDYYVALSKGEVVDRRDYFIIPYKSHACYHHDYDNKWDRLINLKLITNNTKKQLISWTYCHSITDKGIRVLRDYCSRKELVAKETKQ
jgi:hypothetical protein